MALAVRAAAASDIFGYAIPFELDTGSDSARVTFENGCFCKLHYLRKNQRISIAFVTDAFKAIMSNVTRVDSKDNNADLGVTWCDSAAQP